VLCELERGQKIGVFGPLGNGFRTDVERPLLVAAASESRPSRIPRK